MKLTQYTNLGDGPAPGKHYWLDKGELANLTNGRRIVFRAEQVELTLDALPAFIAETPEGVYLTSGLSEHLDATAISIPRLKEVLSEGRSLCGEGRPLIAFSNADTPHRAVPSTMVVDSDGEQPAPVHQQMITAVPALEGYARVEASSSSSNIHKLNKDSSREQLTGLKGLHTFYAVQDGSDIPRALEVLHKRLVLAGFTQNRLSKAGSFLERSAVDLALSVPSQPIYIRPVLGDGLVQDKQVKFFPGTELMDTRSVLPDLSSEEEKRYLALIAEDRARLKPEMKKARAKYIDERAKEIVVKSKGVITFSQARSSVAQSLLTSAVDPSHPVTLSDGTVITVADILANPDAYHLQTCRDVEDPNYGSNSVAKIYCDGPQKLIHSFAHGGRKYLLQEEPFADASAADFDALIEVLDAQEDKEVEAIRGNPVIAGWLEADLVGIKRKVWTEQGNRPAGEVLLQVLCEKLGIGVEVDDDDDEGDDAGAEQPAEDDAGVPASEATATESEEAPAPVWSITPDQALGIPGIRFRKSVEAKAKLLRLDLELAETLLKQWVADDKTEAVRAWADFFGEHLDVAGIDDALVAAFVKTASRLLGITPKKALGELESGIRDHDARLATLKRKALPRVKPKEEPRMSQEEATAERLRADAAEAAAELEACRWIAENPLKAFDANMDAAGLAGERQSAFFCYLILTSAHLVKPANGLLRGPAGSGKSYVMKAAAAVFPEEMVYMISSMSAKALVYEPGGFMNRTIILEEAESLVRNKDTDKNEVAEMLRVLLSEQRLTHKVVVKNPDTNAYETQTITVEGPTNLLTSTTRSLLDPEIESRMVDRWSDTSEVHMRAVLDVIGERAAGGKAPDRQLKAWHTFASWVRRGPSDVVIPFAKLLSRSWSTGAGSRTFRDLNNLISVTRASALVHRLNRKLSDEGLIVADPQDYRIAYDLLGDRIDELAGQRVPDALKPKFNNLRAAYVKAGSFSQWTVSVRELAAALGASRSSAHRDLARLETHGLVAVHRDPVAYRSAKLNITPVSLSEATEIFKKGSCIPTPDELVAAIAREAEKGRGKPGADTVEAPDATHHSAAEQDDFPDLKTTALDLDLTF
jgi:hypothetical protein